MDTHPDRFIALYIHRDDAYPTPWGNQRDIFYDVTGYPSVIYDGLYDAYYEGWLQGYPYPYTQYMPIALDERLAVPTDVTVDVELWGNNETWNAQATVCIEPGGTGKTMSVHIVRVLDHYPAGTYYRNCVMDGAQLTDVTLTAGECTLIEQTYILDPASVASPEEAGVVLYVQDPLTSWPAEIFQAGQAFGPPTGVFTDGLESGLTTSWSSVVP